MKGAKVLEIYRIYSNKMHAN